MGLDAKDEVAVLITTQTFKLSDQPFSHANSALAHSLRVESPDRYQAGFEVYVGPHQAENLAPTHAGIQCANQNRFQVLSLTVASCQESVFLFSTYDSLSRRLFSRLDKGVSLLKWVPDNPAIRHRDVQDPAHLRELAVHCCNRTWAFPRLSFLVGTFRIASKNDRNLKPMSPIALQVAVRYRA
jgi:hypothetical protein